LTFDVRSWTVLARLLRLLASMASPTRRSFLVPVDLAHAEAAKRSVDFVLTQLALTDKDSVSLLNVIASTITQLPPSFGIGAALASRAAGDARLVVSNVQEPRKPLTPSSLQALTCFCWTRSATRS